VKKFASRIYDYVINPPSDDELKKAWQQSDLQLPVIWMLGKTGAGKSSIVQQLTGHSRAKIGNGFMPCTRNSSYFDYPQEHPILRFLDTRGLGDVDYEVDEDLDTQSHSSHALLVVGRIRDAEQSAVLDTLKKIRKSARHIGDSAIIAVHTGADELANEHDRRRAVQAHQDQIEAVWGKPVDSCSTGFGERSDGSLNDLGADRLRELIGKKMPELSLWLQRSAHHDAEQNNFDLLKKDAAQLGREVRHTLEQTQLLRIQRCIGHQLRVALCHQPRRAAACQTRAGFWSTGRRCVCRYRELCQHLRPGARRLQLPLSQENGDGDWRWRFAISLSGRHEAGPAGR